MIISELLASYRRIFKENPVGFNDEITTAITGRNIKGIASISKDHPTISEQDELLDR